MTYDESIAFLKEVARILQERRPELLKPRQGAWKGPLANPELPAGLFFTGPSHLVVCVSPWSIPDNSWWLHVSASIRDRDPTYRELSEVRQRFFRPDDAVIHVWPPVDEHVNDHQHCLHLWARIDGVRTVPDLRAEDGGV